MTRTPARRHAAAGFTLVEVTVVVVLIGILSTIAALSFPRAVEQARADLAAANLRSIQLAQRCYRLEHGTYATSIAQLREAGLLEGGVHSADDPPADLASHDPSYTYAIDPDDPLVIRAARTDGPLVDGKDGLSIDADGYVRGEIRFAWYGAGAPPVRPARVFSHQDP